LRGKGESIYVTGAAESPADMVNVGFEEAHDPTGDSVRNEYSEFADYLFAHRYVVSTIDPNPPIFSNNHTSPSNTVYDSYTGGITCYVDIEHDSVLCEVGSRYRFTSTSWSDWGVWTGYFEPGKRQWSTEIQRSTWINRVDEELYHEWYAIDDNNATSYSPTYFGGNISDDDTTSPLMSGLLSYEDETTGSYRIQVNVTDQSGICDVQFRYKFDEEAWYSWSSYIGSAGDVYWYDIPETEWTSHIGEIMYWETYAEDYDDDRAKDRATTTSLTYETVIGQYQITFQQSDCPLPVVATIDDRNYTLPATFFWNKGSSHNISVPSTVTFSSDTRYVFTQWHDDVTPFSTRLVVVTSPAEYTVYYKTQYKVTFQQSGSERAPQLISNNVTCSLPCSFWFDSDSPQSFNHESPVSGEVGIQYVLTSVSHVSPVIFVSPMTVSAYYKTQYYLTVGVEPEGITIVGGGEWYDARTIAMTGIAQLTISGVNVRYEFVTWKVDGTDVSGNPLSVTMDSPHTAIAIYKTHLIGWQDYLSRPETIGLFIGVFSIICTVITFVATRRKRTRIKTLLDEIDSAYLSLKKNVGRCEAELYRLRDTVLEDYKNGKITEQSYDILNKRINEYLKTL